MHKKWMEFFEQIWVKTYSWLDAKAGDGGALGCRSLLEGIAVEKFKATLCYLRGKP